MLDGAAVQNIFNYIVTFQIAVVNGLYHGWQPVELSNLYKNFSKPAISFGKNMQRAFEDGTLNKDELIEEIRKLDIDVIDM